MVHVKHGIKSPLVRTSRQLTLWKKTFRDAEKTAVTKKRADEKENDFSHSDLKVLCRMDPADDCVARLYHPDEW